MGEEKDRIKKLKQIKARQIDAYPARSDRSYTCQEVNSKFDQIIKKKAKVVLAGRLVLIRLHGKVCFAHLEDGTARFQIYFREDDLGQEQYQFFVKNVDLGDFLEVRGQLFKTKKGEKTLRVIFWRLLTKTILPLPEKWHGLTDIETRFRQRYLDLLANKEVKDIFIKRSQIIKLIRKFFDRHGYIEVETPVLQPLAGGAAARPFVTHHQALNLDLYLRIAPELYLKRLIISGMERVYEISRCFRNEGIDWAHNPEFTQIEFYQAYADYNDLMELTEKLMENLLKNVAGKLTINYQGKKINFKSPYPRLDFKETLLNYTGIDIEKEKDLKKLAQKAGSLELEIDKTWGWGKIIDEIYKEIVRPKIVNPAFLINHPIELSPLAKQIPGKPEYVERFQLIVAGLEICNGFTELNDPLEQERRFKEQQKLLNKGDQEAQPFDQDFLTALKYGMPPTAGEGIGIDRLVCLLTNTHNIKEVILFPVLRPRSKT